MDAVRNPSIDVAKGLGIALVVLGHNQLVLRGGVDGAHGLLFHVIYAFHVPLFFFLSGLFVKPGARVRAVLADKAESLLKPYFVVLMGLGAVLAVVRLLRQDFHPDWLKNYLGGVLYGVGSTIEWTPLWFLPCLFLVNILGYLVVRAGQARVAVIGPCAAIAAALGLLTIGAGVLPWSADLVPICLAFFLAGFCMRRQVLTMQLNLPLLASLVLVFAGLNYIPAVVDLNSRVYQAPVLSTLRALTGIAMCLQVASALARCAPLARLLGFAGTGSLYILIFHGVCQGQVTHTAGRWLGSAIAGQILGFLAGMIVPLLLLIVVSRIPPLAALISSRGSRSPNY